MSVKVTKDLAKTDYPVKYLSPFDEVEKWFSEAFTRPFSMLSPRVRPMLAMSEFETASPTVDIYEEGNELVFKADLPGMTREDITVNLEENLLTISGEKKTEEKIEKGSYFRYERSHGTFYRSFELPHDVDIDKIKAHLENGVLEIRLPKTAEVEGRTRKISIN